MASQAAKATLSGVVVAALFLGAVAARISEVSAQAPRVRWYAVNGDLNEKGQSVNLGDSVHTFALNTGWSCTVGVTSKQLPAYEARTTICEKGAEAFQFVVQCERSRPKDHTQIGFLRTGRRLGDFIEVGCEFL
jgi:hypothetical protein